MSGLPRMSFRVMAALLLTGLMGGGLAAADVALPKADAVVATDGSGQFRSVQEAISAAPMRTADTDPPWVIFVKAGTYRERIYVQRERGRITVVGEDADKTVITYDLNAKFPGPDGKPIGTFRTPTVEVDGDGMIWENLTIANSAGPVGQALALRVDGDRVIFRHCRFLGWQDTILVNRGRQYFADCYIEGHVDFIFGAATAYFDHCRIHCLKDGYITAASTPEGQPYGFVFSDCILTGAPGVKTYLGRPWRDFARTVFLRTEMSDVVRPEGWHNWNKPIAEKTTHYAEFACTGPGSDPVKRVAWEQKQESGDSSRYTTAAVLAGADHWRPVPGPTLFLAADSTVADKADLGLPERGWGQLFRELVQAPLQLDNCAINGRSTKSFRDQGHWQRLLDLLQPEDWVLIEFGHNDAKKDDPLRYAAADTDYRANLIRMVHDVRAKGAHPILATPVARRRWTEAGEWYDAHGAYPGVVREVAAAEKVPLLDLEARTRAYFASLGPEGSKSLFLHFAPGEHPRLPEGRNDDTHFSEKGARAVAGIVAAEMLRIKLPIAAYLKPDPANTPSQFAPVKWKDVLKQPVAWYASADARDLADTVLLYQFPNGGWPKNREMTLTPAAEAASRPKPVPDDEQMPTIDNDATHQQLRFLARVITAVNGSDAHRAAVIRGLNYLLAAQYPNGGWPQFYPLREGYYTHITFNDDAMADVMEVLQDVARGRAPFAFVEPELRVRAAAAVVKGIDCILRCQIVDNGELTVWCAEHDEHTLAPAPARKFEPVSLSGGESVEVVRVLMRVEEPSPEVVSAVEAAVTWFKAVQIDGLRYEQISAPNLPKGRDRVVVADPAAKPLWARFYELGTNRPIFSGRDSVIRYQMSEIEHERRIGYKWYVDSPAKLLAKDYPEWQARLGRFTLANAERKVRPQYPDIRRVEEVLPAGVTAHENLVYAPPLALDIYQPAGSGPFPAVLIVHAGGWDSGSREMERPFAKRLAGLGFVTVPVSYRLGPEARFPAALHDLKAAVRWLRAHAMEYAIDPTRIAVTGMSAGGQLAALLGATNDQAEFEGGVGERSGSSAVQAVVDIDGLSDFTGPALVAQQEQTPSAPVRYLGGNFRERPEVWRAASAISHVGPHSAPTLFINSTVTSPILPGRAEMADKLHAAGIASETVVLPDTPHPFWLFHPWFEPTLAATDHFLKAQLPEKK